MDDNKGHLLLAWHDGVPWAICGVKLPVTKPRVVGEDETVCEECARISNGVVESMKNALN